MFVVQSECWADKALAQPTALNQDISAGRLNFSLRHVDKPNILSKNGLENFLVNV